jgi:hypothetical protein
MDDGKIKGFRCECSGETCELCVDVGRQEAAHMAHLHYLLIVDGCETGAPAGYSLKEHGEGYGWYGLILETT